MDTQIKCCGNCRHFKDESIDGKGWCEEQSWVTEYSKVCKLHEFGSDGWTEITPDNANEVTDLAVVTDGKVYKMAIQWHLGIGTMAKVGGYYYYVLPELKLNEI